VVGGFDFYQSTFNRAVQAKRQPGSSFKPFIYSAALEKGFTLASTIYDAPVVIEGGAVTEAWRPENYSGRFYGPTRLREALVHSRNLVSIRLLRSVGIDYAIDYVKRFGFGADQLPRGLSLALGTGTATPGEMAAGYAVFATGGYRLDPYFISRVSGPDGPPLWEAPPIELCEEAPCTAGTGPQRVLRPQNAFLMTSMMQDVVRRGTGRRARKLGRHDLAGKTGTTNDHHDAWFCGFNRKLVVTTWVGFDQPRSLGNGETGSRAALPMWIAFMKEALQGIPDEPPVQPVGLVTVRIDPATGLLAHPEQTDAMFEVFDAASVPTRAAAHDLPAPTAEVEHSMAIPEQLF
jgi:penicillin-binding protein 1A